MKRHSYLLLLVATVFTSSTVFAGIWDCPPGQPVACENATRDSAVSCRKKIQYYKDELSLKNQDIARCKTNYDQSVSDRNEAKRKYTYASGGVSGANKSFFDYQKLYQQSDEVCRMIELSQSQLYELLREMVAQLKNVTANDSITELVALKNNYEDELTSTFDSAKKQALTLSITILKEIIATIQAPSYGSNTLLEKINLMLIAAETKPMTRIVIDGALSEQEVDLRTRVAGALISAKNLRSSIGRNLESARANLDALNKQIESLRTAVKNQESNVSYYSNQCANLNNYYNTTVPQKLNENQTQYDADIASLTSDGCRKLHCTYRESGKDHTGGADRR